MKDVFYLEVESSKKDTKTKDRIATTDLILKKEGKQFVVLDCEMPGGVNCHRGERIKANIMGVRRFLWNAFEQYNKNPERPMHITMNRRIFDIHSWGEEATEDILPDHVLNALGVDPNTVSRRLEVNE